MLEASITNREKGALLNQIKELHKRYLSMVSKEIILVGKEEIFQPDTRYEDEKEKTLDLLTESINKLTLTTQAELINKIGLFKESDTSRPRYPLS